MLDKVIKAIEENDSIVIFGHPFPDGDCYGSQIGLRDCLRLTFPDKKVYAVGSGYHRFHKRLGEMDEIGDDVIANSLAVLVDGNDLTRMEDARVYNAKCWAKIDHHVDTGHFNEGPQFIDEDANSTCQIITRLIMKYHYKINKNIAEALFLGILTDTGRFQYVNDYISTFKEVSWLCEQGCEPEALNKILNITYEPLLAFKGYVYSNYVKTEGGVIYLSLSKENLKNLGIPANKAGSMVNLLSNVQGYPIWAFFCENEDGTNHAEFRSNGPAVQPVAARHGGGGHLQAAGVTLSDSKKETIQQIVDELDQVVSEYKEENE